MRKKILMLSFTFVALFAGFNTAFAKSILSCGTVIQGAIIDEKIPNTVSTIIMIIRIAVPVLLVIFGSLDLVKGITAGKEDEIKKGQQIFIKRLIAGALVFFVSVIVNFVISLAADSSSQKSSIMKCADCFLNKKCTYCADNYHISDDGKTCVKD